MYWPVIIASIFFILFLLWRIYKRFMGPTYIPGCVHDFVTKSPEKFDAAHLLDETTDSTWEMPDGISIYHMSALSHRSKNPDQAESESTDVNNSEDNGKTDILCISGGPGVAVSKPWAVFQTEALMKHSISSKFTFHHYHPRGCGRSTQPIDKFPSKRIFSGVCIIEETLGLGQQISDIERIRRRLNHNNNSNVEEKIILVGHSFGAFISLLYASEFPENVKGLILLSAANVLNIPPAKDDQENDFFGAIEAKLEDDRDRQEFAKVKSRLFDFQSLPLKKEQDMKELQQDIARFYFQADPIAKEIAERRMDDIGGWMAMASYFSFGMQMDYRDELKKRLKDSKFPVLLVGGSDDLFNMKKINDKYDDLFPPSNVENIVLKAGHSLQEEVPDELGRLISNFINSRVG